MICRILFFFSWASREDATPYGVEISLKLIMNQSVLPQQCRDFMNKQYWKRFFKKIKKEGQATEYFEWYGNYTSFDHLFKKFIQSTDLVLHAGCGKSLLSEQLYDYNVCKNIVNVDFEKESLVHMQKRSENNRPELRFECLSLIDELPTPDNHYDVILDKGTLDAIYPDEGTDQVDRYLVNMHRILKENGKFIIVSLLQEHVLKKLLDPRWQIEIQETVIEKSKLYPFFIVLTKKLSQKAVQLNLLNGATTKVDYQSCLQEIKKLQLQNHFIVSIHKLRQSQSFTLDLWSNLNKQTPRYTLFIYDHDNPQVLLNKTCACFIIPQGREQSYLFATQQGHKDLQKQAQMSRLVIARMNAGHKFENMKEVQQELSEPMRGLIPKGCTNQPCPFMTDGDEIGEKQIVFEADDCYVEDLQSDDAKYRRLILKSSLDLIQCQARIVDNKVDNTYLDFEAHVAIVAGFAFCQRAKEVLILGGGVGLLSRFLAAHLNVKVTNIELSEDIVAVAKSLFDFKETDLERMVCADALDYVEQAQQSHEFDVIIVDINSTQQNSISPPGTFLSKVFLEKLRSMLTEQGVIIYNILDPMKELKSLEWDLYYSRKCENEVNEVHYLINRQLEQKQLDVGLLKEIENSLKEAQNQFAKVKKWDSVLNLGREIGEIKLKWPQLKTQAFQTQEVQLVEDGQVKNARKEFYQEDLEKVQKKKRKRKNKH